MFSQSACAPAITASDPDTGLSLGYVAGDVTSDGAVVWLRADRGSLVSLQYSKDPALSQFTASEPVPVKSDCDNTAHIKLERLEPATTYYYRAVVAGKKAGPVGRFITAPRPDDPAVVKFAFSGDTREGYQPFTIMDSIRAMQPHFFIYLGDTIYADRGGTATQLPEYWAKYRRNRNDAASRRLYSDTSLYVIWDDHEVANDYDGPHPLGATGRRAFFDYWPVRRDAREPDRLYRSFRWGKAMELFLLDGRQYRNRARGSLLGEQQKRWLFDAVESSTAMFKIIATAVPFFGGGSDRWDGYPREREEVLGWIAEKNIKGVTLISADLHYAAVTRLPGNRGLKEIVTGPMAAQMNVFATGMSERFEFFSNKTFNYGMITIDPHSRPPQAMVEIFDQDNGSLYKTKIDAV